MYNNQPTKTMAGSSTTRRSLRVICMVGAMCLLWPPQATLAAQTEAQTTQAANRKIQGKVTNAEGEPLAGAVVVLDGKQGGVITNSQGEFTIEATTTDQLNLSFLGMESQTIAVGQQTFFNVSMTSKSDMLEQVTVVAFSTQKKENVVGSITTVKPSDLKVPSSNLTNSLAGRVAGVIAYQRSGEPGRDNTEFFIRGVTTFGYKKDPLILVDGMEVGSDDLARLQPDDIEQFSIMKDAAATALYGARGANGVIFVSTKEGREGRAKVSVRIENSWSSPTQMVKLSDPITYMKLNNEAVATRNPLGILPYSKAKIAATQNPNRNKYVYPAVDWLNEMFNKNVMNQRVNLNVSGGGQVARYYLAATFNKDNGLMKNENRNGFDTNINLKQYNIRANFNVNITKTTEIAVRFQGNFDDYRGPVDAGNILFDYAVHASPVDYPKIFAPDAVNGSTKHPLYGNLEGANHINPYALMSRGYKDYSRTHVLAQADINQDFSFITKGLKARALLSTARNSYFDTPRTYKPFYYKVDYYNQEVNTYNLAALNATSGTEYLDYNGGGKSISSKLNFEGAIEYSRDLSGHQVSGMVVYQTSHQVDGNPATLIESLPYRNQGLSGRFTYGFDSRYMVELNFGYNGSERFAQNERWGFFPAAGATWTISNEPFWSDGLKSVVNTLRFKATYGLVGNDAIGRPGDRFFYLSDVNMNYDYRNMYYGSNFGNIKSGILVRRYANKNITWEVARKLNMGIELGLFNKLTIQADYFSERRSNILMTRSFMPTTMGLEADVLANVGEASGRGMDMSVDYKHSFNKDLWITARGNFTYATSKFIVADEPDYSAAGLPWRSRVGYNLSQHWGYIAERLFIDDADIANSPTQTFGPYMPGDVKYKDINKDGKVDDSDLMPIGFPETPEIVYGLGASIGFKGFDFSFFFQGNARQSFFIDAQQVAPFNNPAVKTAGVGAYSRKTALFDAFAKSYWSESNPNVYATWPRLSTDSYSSENNYQKSTWWMRDGTFLRLKSLEIGYTLPRSLTDRIRLSTLRVYLSGTNLLTFSKFKLWDPEMGGWGIGYPLQRVYNIGLQVNF